MARAAAIAALAGLLLAGAGGAAGYLNPTHGDVAGLSPTCLADLNTIFNTHYLLTSTEPSQDNRTQPWFLNAQRRMGCRLGILEALQQVTADDCPSEEQLLDCFWVAGKEWSTFVHKCELFKSQAPLPACSDAPGEAAEGVPSCSATQTAILNGNQGRRRLLAGGPANDAGLATWQYSLGEAAGLQYDPYAPAGSPYAQPPISVLQAAAGSDPTLAATAEAEGGDVSAGSTAQGNAGCFPSFWSAADFDAWLNGKLVETDRPKDYGGVNAVGLVSVLIYTLALCSLGFF